MNDMMMKMLTPRTRMVMPQYHWPSVLFPRAAAVATRTMATQNNTSWSSPTTTIFRRKYVDLNRPVFLPLTSTRYLSSSYSSQPPSLNLPPPSWQVYGEESCLTVRVMLPEYKTVGNNQMIVVDRNGKLMLELVPRHANGKYQWDTALKMALTPEEAASLLVRTTTTTGNTNNTTTASPPVVEIVRRPYVPSGGGSNPHAAVSQYDDLPNKVFRATTPLTTNASSPSLGIELTVDYELDGRTGQDPPTPQEARGPLGIQLLAGEWRVLQSLIEYSLPRLTGWATQLDYGLQQKLMMSSNNSGDGGFGMSGNSPHNYQGGGGDRRGGGGGGAQGGGSGGYDDVPF